MLQLPCERQLQQLPNEILSGDPAIPSFLIVLHVNSISSVVFVLSCILTDASMELAMIASTTMTTMTRIDYNDWN